MVLTKQDCYETLIELNEVSNNGQIFIYFWHTCIFLSFYIFVMVFFSDHDSVAMVISVFAMLNASIAIGVSEILARTKK